MSKIFYMPAPDLFGVWKDSGATPEFTEEGTIFKFVQGDDGLLAEFSICEEISAQRGALVGLRRWMSSVCAYEGFAPANTKTVATVKPGVAEKLADGNWKVKEKIAVDFVV